MGATILADPGVLVLNVDVDDALVGVLQNWLPTFLRITARERNLSQPLALPNGASYNNPADQSEWTDAAFPAIMVATSRTQGAPIRHADGIYDATWLCVVSAVVRGTQGRETRNRASLYEGAVRRALGHRSAIANAGGIVHGAKWQAAEVRPVADVSRTGRHLAAGMSTFFVYTDQAFKDTAGPPSPDPLPPTVPPTYVPLGTITEVDTTVEDDTTVTITSGPYPGE
jgi:hypothetical protein